MTRQEMIELAIKNLEKANINEIELVGSVTDSMSEFKVHLVKYTPVPWINPLTTGWPAVNITAKTP